LRSEKIPVFDACPGANAFAIDNTFHSATKQFKTYRKNGQSKIYLNGTTVKMGLERCAWREANLSQIAAPSPMLRTTSAAAPCVCHVHVLRSSRRPSSTARPRKAPNRRRSRETPLGCVAVTFFLNNRLTIATKWNKMRIKS
jgi:hypothetical protein